MVRPTLSIQLLTLSFSCRRIDAAPRHWRDWQEHLHLCPTPRSPLVSSDLTASHWANCFSLCRARVKQWRETPMTSLVNDRWRDGLAGVRMVRCNTPDVRQKNIRTFFPFDFTTDEWREFWHELRSVVQYWIDQGLRIFRVDNPPPNRYRFGSASSMR